MKKQNRLVRLLLVVLSSLLICQAEIARYDQSMSDRELDARLSFLESKLEDLQTPSTYWQYGWTGFYGVSAAAQLYDAADEDDSDDSMKGYVGAAKSAAAFAQMMLKPLPVVDGWDDYQERPGNARAEKMARLADAENMLERSARRADERYTWKPHLMAVGINLLGAGIIAGFGDSDDSLGSALLGIAIAEAAIWSQPGAATDYWDSYQKRFSSGARNAFDWRVVPGANSVALEVTF